MFKIDQQSPVIRHSSAEAPTSRPWLGPVGQGAAQTDMAVRIAVLTGSQIRAARALLQWTAEVLAVHAQVGVATIRRMERTDGPVRCLASINLAVRRTLEAAGVEFTSENGLTGVRIRTGLG